MITRSTILHLRIPFSFFLLPVFLFALGNSSPVNWPDTILCFLVIHFLLYPASNGFNSYFDKDEKSIGGLRNPPPVSRELYFISLSLDLAAIILGLIISPYFSIMLLMYGLASKAYSHPSTRLKKYAVTSWIIAGFFQGFFTYLMCILSIEGIHPWGLFKTVILVPAFLCTALLLGSYPMTQIYQHEEDKKRGDITLSIKLGIPGTFLFSALVFIISNILFIFYFLEYKPVLTTIIFEICLLPMIIFFLYWTVIAVKDYTRADYTNTMRLNLISSFCLNIFFTFNILF